MYAHAIFRSHFIDSGMVAFLCVCVLRWIYGAHALYLPDLGTTKLHTVGLSEYQRRKVHFMPLWNVDRASHRSWRRRSTTCPFPLSHTHFSQTLNLLHPSPFVHGNIHVVVLRTGPWLSLSAISFLHFSMHAVLWREKKRISEWFNKNAGSSPNTTSKNSALFLPPGSEEKKNRKLTLGICQWANVMKIKELIGKYKDLFMNQGNVTSNRFGSSVLKRSVTDTPVLRASVYYYRQSPLISLVTPEKVVPLATLLR